MKFIYLTFLFFLSFNCLSQDQAVNVELNLDGLRDVEKNNGYNAKEVDYYNKSDKLIYTICYDRQGNLEDTPMGIAVIEREYDKRGNLTRQSYFDQDKKPFRTEYVGPASVAYKYDKRGNKIETAYLDEFGQLLTNGLAIVQAKFDSKGNLTEERELDHNKELSGKACIFKYFYDEKGRRIKEEKYDSQESLVKVEDGNNYSIVESKYDDQDRVIERSYRNERGDLIDGTARIVYDYSKKPNQKPPAFIKDQDPHWVEQVYYDSNGTEIKRDFQYLPKKK
ncbi:MAG: hypothetical protein ABJL71_01145 [Cyclobacteriaceae bacterium]